ncbi:hypothetical protein DEM27_17625 [Metarhizobium album]|uniref:Uncharacterized protein n=1 Tax=Metarhizobium album TaxID=2182425 RepID=A0A2U2DPK3_9HYPH|nr:hypothetical protein [Rhizobium album]PWE55246.1 hypothetical protein DEM27_17625 [Rhizobium album]
MTENHDDIETIRQRLHSLQSHSERQEQKSRYVPNRHTRLIRRIIRLLARDQRRYGGRRPMEIPPASLQSGVDREVSKDEI